MGGRVESGDEDIGMKKFEEEWIEEEMVDDIHSKIS
jgi:hypothetical protein